MCIALTIGLWISGLPWGQSAPSIDPARLAELLSDLSSPQISQREQATAELATLDGGSLDSLVTLYRQEEIHERRLRLREVIERVFYQQYMKGEEGFIGIRLYAVPDVLDPLTGRRMECVYVQDVLAGQPAEAAGIQNGDLLVGLDGKPVSWFFSTPAAGEKPAPAAGPGLWIPQGQIALSDPKIERFTRHVKRRTPGSIVTLDLLRCQKHERQIACEVSADPRATLDGATWTAAPTAMLGAVQPGEPPRRGGLMITQLLEDSQAQRVGLKQGDVLVAVAAEGAADVGVRGQPEVDEPLDAGQGALALGHLSVPLDAGPEWLEGVLDRGGTGRRIWLSLVRIDQLRLPLALGRRPVRLMNETDLRDARERFLTWWRQTGNEEMPRRTEPVSFWPVNVTRAPSWLPEATVLP